jgi:ankyrin repeat protein
MSSNNNHTNEIETKSKFGFTPLQQACFNNDIEAARILLSNGADPNTRTEILGESPLILVSNFESPIPFVELLLKYGADINSKTSIDQQTLLMSATVSGNYEFALFCIDHGADINARDFNGSTALHYAVLEKETLNIARLLVLKGANTQIMDSEGNTPYDLAFITGLFNDDEIAWLDNPESSLQEIASMLNGMLNSGEMQVHREITTLR